MIIGFANDTCLLWRRTRSILVIRRFLHIVSGRFGAGNFNADASRVRHLQVRVKDRRRTINVFRFTSTFHRHRYFNNDNNLIRGEDENRVRSDRVRHCLLRIRRYFGTTLKSFELVQDMHNVPTQVFRRIARSGQQ